MSLKDHCKCGHAKESHFEKKYNCLSCRSDEFECKGYRLYSDPDTPPTERTFKAAPPVIDPFDGFDVQDPDDGTPITWPMIPIPGFGDP
jgi:hypothetical protein